MRQCEVLFSELGKLSLMLLLPHKLYIRHRSRLAPHHVQSVCNEQADLDQFSMQSPFDARHPLQALPVTSVQLPEGEGCGAGVGACPEGVGAGVTTGVGAGVTLGVGAGVTTGVGAGVTIGVGAGVDPPSVEC